MDLLLQKIHQSSIRLLSPLETPITYKHVVEEAKKILNAKYGTILLEQNGELERVYATTPLLKNAKIRKQGRTYQAFQTQKPSVSLIHHKKDMNIIAPEIKSITFIPLAYKNHAIGVLNLLSEEAITLTKPQLKALELFGTIAYFSIQRSQRYEHIRQSLQKRDLFISLAAHEIKNPLTALHNYLELMNMTHNASLPFETEWITNSLEQTKQVMSLVNEFLSVEQAENNRLNFSLNKASIRKIIYQAIASFQITHQGRIIIFKDELNEEDLIEGQQNKLLQAVTNILNNAVKFSDNTSQIFIKLYAEGNYIHISVQDFGCGIPKNEVNRIFDKFYQARNNYLHEGQGLGLYLTKEIIEQHHGKIKVLSKINEGTIILLSLPRIYHALS